MGQRIIFFPLLSYRKGGEDAGMDSRAVNRLNGSRKGVKSSSLLTDSGFMAEMSLFFRPGQGKWLGVGDGA
jgi:hypothetical protein